MARGQKYNNDIKEKAFALLAVNNSVAAVANKLGIPRTTINSWKEEYDREAKEGGEPTIVELRQEKKKQFVDDAWEMIGKVKTILERRLDRAIKSESEMDELVVEKSLSIIKSADLILLLLEAGKITGEDEEFIHLLRPMLNKVIVAVNKC